MGTLLTAGVWGASFAGMKYALQAGLSVGAMLTCRFLIGALGLGMLLLALRVPMKRAAVKDGLVLGLLLTAIFWLQAGGFVTTTTTKSGFITGLYVLFTPVASVVLGHRLKTSHALGALVATAGLFLLVHTPGAPSGGWILGDTLTLVCAVGCGFQIALTGIYSRRSSGWVLAFTQVATVAVLSLVITAAAAGPHGFQTARKALALPGTWVALVYLGVLATALAFYLMITLPGPPGRHRGRHPLLPGTGVHRPAGHERLGSGHPGTPRPGPAFRRGRSRHGHDPGGTGPPLATAPPRRPCAESRRRAGARGRGRWFLLR